MKVNSGISWWQLFWKITLNNEAIMLYLMEKCLRSVFEGTAISRL